MSDNKNFFAKQTDSSRVKATIISEYFPQYCKIISRRHVPRKFGYFDMFAGPGIYDDGSLSTPLLIGKACYEDSFLRDRVWMVFNDMGYGMTLKENFERFYQSGTFAKLSYPKAKPSSRLYTTTIGSSKARYSRMTMCCCMRQGIIFSHLN